VPERTADGMWHFRLPTPCHGVELFEVRDSNFVDEAKKSLFHCVVAPPVGGELLVDVLPVSRESLRSRILILCAKSQCPRSLDLQFTTSPPFGEATAHLVGEFLDNLRVESRWLEGAGVPRGPIGEEPSEEGIESLSKAVERAVLATVKLPTLPPSQYFTL